MHGKVSSFRTRSSNNKPRNGGGDGGGGSSRNKCGDLVELYTHSENLHTQLPVVGGDCNKLIFLY